MTETETMSEVKRCRICMGAKPYQISLFRRNLGMKVMNLADVKVAEGDGLPSTICLDCEIDLEKCYEFRAQVQWSDKKFREDLSLCQVDVEEYNIKEEHCTLDTLTDAKHLKNDSDHENNDNIREDTSSSEQSDDEDNKNPLAHVVVEDRRVESDVEMSEDPLGQEEPLIETQIDETETSIDPLISVKDEAMAMETGSSINVMSTPSTSDRLEQKTMASGPDKNTPETSAPPVVREIVAVMPFPNWPKLVKNDDRGGMKILPQNCSLLTVIKTGQNIIGIKGATTSNISDINPAKAKKVEKISKVVDGSVCFICNVDCGSVELLQDHLERKGHMCRICTKEFETHGYLETHLTSHKTYMCKKCDERFLCKTDLFQHRKKTNTCTTSRFKCEICGKSFAKRYIVSRHMLTHYGDKERMLSCIVCAKLFTVTATLKEHLIKVHIAYEHMKCTVCNKLLLGPMRLKTHTITAHTNTYEVSCHTCGKVFKNNNRLSLHEKIHDNLLRLCEVCGKSCKGVKSMTAHMKTEHPKSGKFLCKFCNEPFEFEIKLQRHVRRVHKKQQLSKVFCEICGKEYKNGQVLKQHKLIHSNEKKFKCELCGAAFKQKVSLITHGRVHSGISKYHCENCGKYFRWKQTFDNHVKKCLTTENEKDTVNS